MSLPPPVRRADKALSEDEARALLAAGHSGRLATIGPDGWPYCVPLLYVWMMGEIWVHNTAARGHLRRNVEHEARVAFEIDAPGEVFAYGRFECDSSLAYQSVIAFGRIRVVEDRTAKQRFCEALLTKYHRPEWEEPAAARPQGFFPRLDLITVYSIALERVTGKETPLPTLAERWPAKDMTKTPNAKPRLEAS
ncbi:MAG: pyridoxamine 5'-phosphate oxidase family protein [Stellaceae bacterium]